MTREEKFMRRALELARRAQERTWPNPMVGAVVVKQGRIVGEGYHHRAGLPHAEVNAIEEAGPAARGADLYVTLEPCHCWGRTGPCSAAIKAAGIKRVFVGTLDPNPRERGKGLRCLRRLQVEVRAGILEKECRRLNQVYNVFIVEKRPFVLVKAAVSLDGRLATSKGDARWLSGEAALVYAHRLRARAQAVMIGARTAQLDDPALDVRLVAGRDPDVVLVDSRLSLAPEAKIFRVKSRRRIFVYCSSLAKARKRRELERAGAFVIPCPARGGRLDLEWILHHLFQHGIYLLLVEGGGKIIGSLLERRLVDRMEIIVTGFILGQQAVPLAALSTSPKLADCPRLQDISFRRLGGDILVCGYPLYRGRGK